MTRTNENILRASGGPHRDVVERRWQRRLLRRLGIASMTEYADLVRAEIDRQLAPN